MDGWTERQDGQDRWEYGMNHMDGKDEEEIDDEKEEKIFIFLSLFIDGQHSLDLFILTLLRSTSHSLYSAFFSQITTLLHS